MKVAPEACEAKTVTRNTADLEIQKPNAQKKRGCWGDCKFGAYLVSFVTLLMTIFCLFAIRESTTLITIAKVAGYLNIVLIGVGLILIKFQHPHGITIYTALFTVTSSALGTIMVFLLSWEVSQYKSTIAYDAETCITVNQLNPSACETINRERNRILFNITGISLILFCCLLFPAILIRFCVKFHQNYKKVVKCRTSGSCYDSSFRHWLSTSK